MMQPATADVHMLLGSITGRLPPEPVPPEPVPPMLEPLPPTALLTPPEDVPPFPPSWALIPPPPESGAVVLAPPKPSLEDVPPAEAPAVLDSTM